MMSFNITSEHSEKFFIVYSILLISLGSMMTPANGKYFGLHSSSSFMLAISRAVGETMIVVMAAGLAANLSINPLDAVTTITVQIATLLVGDQEFDSPKTLSAFALGFVLFFFTLALNYIALRIVQKYREQYD